MTTTYFNATQNGHSKTIASIEQVIPPQNESVIVIEEIDQLLKTRTGDDLRDWNNIDKACRLIYKHQSLIPVDKTYFDTQIQCCYCGQTIQGKLHLSLVRQRKSVYVKVFNASCYNLKCSGCVDTFNLKNKQKSSWRPSDNTWVSAPPRFRKSKQKVSTQLKTKGNAFEIEFEFEGFQLQSKVTLDEQIQEKIKNAHPNVWQPPSKILTGEYSFHINTNAYSALLAQMDEAIEQKWMLIANVANITEPALLERMSRLQGVCCIISDVHSTYSTKLYTPKLLKLFEELPRFDLSRVDTGNNNRVTQPYYLPRMLQLNSNVGNIDHNKQWLFFAPKNSTTSNTTNKPRIVDRVLALKRPSLYFPITYSHGSINWTKQGSRNGDSWQVNDIRDKHNIELINAMQDALITKATIAQIVVD
jgi:hypothetical protein